MLKAANCLLAREMFELREAWVDRGGPDTHALERARTRTRRPARLLVLAAPLVGAMAMLTASLAGAQALTSATAGKTVTDSTSNPPPNMDGNRISVLNSSGKDIKIANTWQDWDSPAGPKTLRSDVGDRYEAAGKANFASPNKYAKFKNDMDAAVTIGDGKGQVPHQRRPIVEPRESAGGEIQHAGTRSG